MTAQGIIQAIRDRHDTRAISVRRSWIGAWFAAEISVRGGVTMDEHLGERLAVYSAKRPAGVIGYPWTLAVSDGRIVRGPAVTDPRVVVLGDPAGVDAALASDETSQLVKAARAMTETQRANFARDLAAQQELLDRVESRRRDLDDEEVSLRAALDSDLHTGRAIAAKTLRRDDLRRGRPTVHGAVRIAGTGVFATALIAGESLLLYPIFADLAGADPDLVKALSTEPGTAVPPVVASMVAGAAIFGVAEYALRAYERAVHPGPALQRVASFVGALALTGLYVSGVCALGELREGALAAQAAEAAVRAGIEAVQSAVPSWTTKVLSGVVPLGAAWMIALLRDAWTERRAAQEARRRWDITESERVEVRERAEERIERAGRLRAEVAREVEAARGEVRALEERARAAEAALGEAVARDRARAECWLASAEAALATDRTVYALVATRHGRADLLRRAETTEDSGVRAIQRVDPFVSSQGRRTS